MHVGTDSAKSIKCTGSDLFDCITFRKKNLCAVCLGPDHSRKTCTAKKSYTNLCFRCMLPSKVDGVKIHGDGYAKTCTMQVGYNLWAVCWAMFHSEMWRVELFQEFKDAPKEKKGFSDWMAKKRPNGMPNSVYVYSWAVKEGGIFK